MIAEAELDAGDFQVNSALSHFRRRWRHLPKNEQSIAIKALGRTEAPIALHGLAATIFISIFLWVSDP
jgi:hypothetical protein